MDWEPLKRVNGFNKGIAHLLATASADAYLEPRDKTFLEDKWKCEIDQHSMNETDVTVFKGEAIIIAFRGTELISPDYFANPHVPFMERLLLAFKDVFTDLNALKCPISRQFDDATVDMSQISAKDWEKYSNCYVHEGFLEAYRQVAPIIHDLARNDGREVFLCGHSAGGAIANIAALELEMRGIQFRRSYTYGAPRVFGWRAAQLAKNRLNGRMFRVVNRNDIVPRVPSCVRFQHVGTLAYINRFDDIQLPVAGYVTYDRILGFRANMIRSHLMKNYLKGTRQ